MSRERIIEEALAIRCPLCGMGPDQWCFKVGDHPTVHAQRIMERNARTETPE